MTNVTNMTKSDVLKGENGQMVLEMLRGISQNELNWYAVNGSTTVRAAALQILSQYGSTDGAHVGTR